MNPNQNNNSYQNPQWQQYGVSPEPPKKKKWVPIVVLLSAIIVVLAAALILLFAFILPNAKDTSGTAERSESSASQELDASESSRKSGANENMTEEEKKDALDDCKMVCLSAQNIVVSIYASSDGTYEAENGTTIHVDQDALMEGELDVTAESADATLELARVKGTVTSVIATEGTVTHLEYQTKKGIVVVYENPDGAIGEGTYTVKE